MRRTPKRSDPEEIDGWREWFIAAHRKRLRDDGHDEATVEHLMIPILAQADAVTRQLREEYRARMSL